MLEWPISGAMEATTHPVLQARSRLGLLDRPGHVPTAPDQSQLKQSFPGPPGFAQVASAWRANLHDSSHPRRDPEADAPETSLSMEFPSSSVVRDLEACRETGQSRLEMMAGDLADTGLRRRKFVHTRAR